MSTPDHIPVSAKELDNLLAQAFLNLDFNDPKNSELMETISTHHLVHASSFIYKLKQLFSGKLVLVILAIIIVTTVILTIAPAFFSEKETPVEPAKYDMQSTVNSNQPGSETYETNDEMNLNSTIDLQEQLFNENPNQEPQSVHVGPGNSTNEDGNNDSHSHSVQADFLKQKKDSTYIFPVLTADETKDHYKQKNKMVNALAKINKEKYAYIPTGSCVYKDQTISVQAFYMQTTEVTNLEYRTFLNDLVVQNRKKDFLEALPDQSQWTKKIPHSYNEPMANMYFSHPAYNDYPVVNISRKGAQMYCAWLTQETNNALKKNNKPLIMDLRLPDEYEWAYAALNGKNDSRYANGDQHLRNSKGCYEINYLGYSMDECRYDSTFNLYLPLKGIDHTSIDGAFYTARVTSYLTNSYGLYCMAGNVSEMIVLHDSKKPATKGGSWFSTDHFLEIEAEDEYRGETQASPFIGFRPVFTALALE